MVLNLLYLWMMEATGLNGTFKAAYFFFLYPSIETILSERPQNYSIDFTFAVCSDLQVCRLWVAAFQNRVQSNEVTIGGFQLSSVNYVAENISAQLPFLSAENDTMSTRKREQRTKCFVIFDNEWNWDENVCQEKEPIKKRQEELTK